MRAPNDCGGRQKVPTMSKMYFLQCSGLHLVQNVTTMCFLQYKQSLLQYSAFSSESPQVRTWGTKLVSCPGRHLTSLRPWRCCRIALLGNSLSYWTTLLCFSLRHLGHLSRNHGRNCRWGTWGRVPPTFSDNGDIICYVPPHVLFRFRNILSSHQPVPPHFTTKLRPCP